MIGSPQNNFQTMQPPQQTPQPRNVMLGNALGNQNMQRPAMPPRQPMNNMSQGMPQPAMLPQSQYGNATPQMPNYEQPQSNASFNMQPPIPNMQNTPQGPIGMNQQGQNRFGVGLARPTQIPQASQVS
jgi:hypothetical protein